VRCGHAGGVNGAFSARPACAAGGDLPSLPSPCRRPSWQPGGLIRNGSSHHTMTTDLEWLPAAQAGLALNAPFTPPAWPQRTLQCAALRL
jgi:hypothetical protein